MTPHCDSTKRRSYPLSRRLVLAGIAGAAGSALLAACGGSSGTSATATTASAPTVAPTAISPVASSPTAGGGQAAAPPTIAPTTTASAVAARNTTAPINAPRATTAPAPTTAANVNIGPAKGKVDPAVLITKADYLAVMGGPANDPEREGQPAFGGVSQSSITYKAAAESSQDFVTVDTDQRDPSTPARIDMKAYWEEIKKAWTDPSKPGAALYTSPAQPLPELGSEAYLLSTITGDFVWVFKNDVVFSIFAQKVVGTAAASRSASTDAGKALAKIAVGRL